MLCSHLLALETGFHSYSYNIQLFKTQCFFHPANHSIRWLVTRGVRWLQDIAKTGRLFLSTDWAASHLLLKEPDINLWRVTAIRQDVDGARVAPMHMAGKCRVGSMDASWPSIWYGLFNGCQHMSTSIYFSSFCLLFFSVLRHLQPAVQLLFVSQLAQQLAKQLDCERGCCQAPVFEASVPLSDSQLEKLPVPEKLKSLCFSFSLLRMQGVQCLEQYLKKHGTQEILEFSDGILMYLTSFDIRVKSVI